MVVTEHHPQYIITAVISRTRSAFKNSIGSTVSLFYPNISLSTGWSLMKLSQSAHLCVLFAVDPKSQAAKPEQEGSKVKSKWLNYAD